MKKMKVFFFAVALFCFGIVSPGCAQEPKEAPEVNAGTWFNVDSFTLADNTDKIVVLEFWATWCPPCRAIIPHLKEMNNEFKDQGVVFVSLSNEDANTVSNFVKSAGMDWVVGAGSSSGGDYKVRGIPAAFIIVDGEIVWNGHPAQGMEEKIRELVAERN